MKVNVVRPMFLVLSVLFLVAYGLGTNSADGCVQKCVSIKAYFQYHNGLQRNICTQSEWPDCRKCVPGAAGGVCDYVGNGASCAEVVPKININAYQDVPDCGVVCAEPNPRGGADAGGRTAVAREIISRKDAKRTKGIYRFAI